MVKFFTGTAVEKNVTAYTCMEELPVSEPEIWINLEQIFSLSVIIMILGECAR